MKNIFYEKQIRIELKNLGGLIKITVFL